MIYWSAGRFLFNLFGIRFYPTNTDLSINLGLIFMKLVEYKKAFNLLGTAIAHDPTNPDALFTFAAEIQVSNWHILLIHYPWVHFFFAIISLLFTSTLNEETMKTVVSIFGSNKFTNGKLKIKVIKELRIY